MAHHDIDDALDAIERRDPSGWEQEPTQQDYDEHHRWAIATYGPRVWATYKRQPWGLFGLDVV